MRFGPLFLLKTPGLDGSYLYLLGNGNLGRRVTNRFQFSTHNHKCVWLHASPG